MTDEIKLRVKKAYSDRAKNLLAGKDDQCCDDDCCETVTKAIKTFDEQSGCCTGEEEISKTTPTPSKVTPVPSFGCNTNLIDEVNLQQNESVLDLGSGPGSDVFKIADLTNNQVTGIDFSSDMIKLANENLKNLRHKNVEFVQGDIENLPFEKAQFDVVISNCVINLIEDKETVFKEAYRVLKDGGRLVFADMITLDSNIPEAEKDEFYCACIGGANSKEEYIERLHKAGFQEVQTSHSFTENLKINLTEVPFESVIFSAFK